ncbi:MAG: hypothetical protein H0W61_17335 [Bacteroidetes bacterium]|nr:hypothetical protein [Bacteroidota bacterium]
MTEILKIASVFITSIFFFVKLGVPTAVIVFKYNFFKVFIVTCSGGITSNIIFTYLSDFILRKVHEYKVRKNKFHRRIVFKKSTRKIIKIKQKFGLAGLAFITPLISQPIGAFFAEKFYKDKKKVILYLSVSVMMWCVVIYLFLYVIHHGITRLS